MSILKQFAYISLDVYDPRGLRHHLQTINFSIMTMKNKIKAKEIYCYFQNSLSPIFTCKFHLVIPHNAHKLVDRRPLPT